MIQFKRDISKVSTHLKNNVFHGWKSSYGDTVVVGVIVIEIEYTVVLARGCIWRREVVEFLHACCDVHLNELTDVG